MECMSKKERRQYSRLSLSFKLFHGPFHFPGSGCQAMYRGEVVDVSASGVLFKSNYSYREGELIRLEIYLGSWFYYRTGFAKFPVEYHKEPFVVLGKVLRTNREKNKEKDSQSFQTAVQYFSVDPGHQIAVDRFVKSLIAKKKVKQNENISSR